MPDFQQDNPPAKVTNPANVDRSGDAPCMLYQHSEATEDGDDVMTIAWAKKTAIRNRVLRVIGADEFDAAKKDGWSAMPVLKAPVKPKAA